MKTRIVALFLLACSWVTPAAALDVLVYPSLAAQETPLFFPSTRKGVHYDRFRDIKEMLHMALEKTEAQYGSYVMRESRLPMTETRYLEELRRGQSVNVVWSATSTQKETDFRPVRIDLRKGYLGYRICLIRKDFQAQARTIKSLEQLRQVRVGQGIGWGDLAIYRHYGVPVITSDYASLFHMLAQDRIDVFPRGLNEVFGEYDAASQQFGNLIVEDSFVIDYAPFPYYLFFSRQNERLARRVEAGLRMMQADGSFDRIFWKYNRDIIERAQLERRTVIRLQNPDLPRSAQVRPPLRLH
jgi:hypothetical protein